MTKQILTMLTLFLALGTTTTFAQTATKVSQQDSVQTASLFDRPAKPKGGEQRFMKYLSKHVTYPKLARENNIHGKVIIQFAVNTDGHLSNIEIIKEIGAGCGEAVKKAIENYPYTWKPAQKNRQPVKTYYVVPFVFSLQ